MNLYLRIAYTRPNFLSSLFRYSTSAPEVTEHNEQVLIDDSDDLRAQEAEIEKKRNISRLSPAHYNLMNDRRPYEEPKTIAHLTVKYSRKMYGKYGIASGVNPSICWPSSKEIQEKQEYEAVAFPFTIKEMMESAAQKRKEENLKIELREKDLADRFVKLAQWKKDLKNKTAKKAAEVAAAKAKKERLVEEVRRHFGFKLDSRDERFQEMLAKREKEQKKAERMAKKEAKEQIMIAKLQQTNAKITEKK